MGEQLNTILILEYGSTGGEAAVIVEKLSAGGMAVHVLKPGNGSARLLAIKTCRTLILLLGARFADRQRQQLEGDLAIYREASHTNISLIPVYVAATAAASAPPGLSGFAGVQLHGDRDRALALLYSQCLQRSIGLPKFRRESAGIRTAQVVQEPDQVLGPIAIRVDGQRIALVTLAGQIAEIDRGQADDRTVHSIPPEAVGISTLLFANGDGLTLCFCTRSGAAGVLRAKRFTVATVAQDARATASAVSPDGTHAAASNGARTVIFSVPQNQILLVLQHSGTITCLRFAADGGHLLGATADGHVIVWRLGQIRPIFVARTPSEATCVDLLLTPEPTLVAALRDSSIRSWELSTGKPKIIFEGHTAACTAIVACNESQMIVSTGNDQTVRFWSSESGECISVEFLSDHSWLAVTPDGGTFAYVGRARDQLVRLCEFNLDSALNQASDGFEKYANAKVLIVGESGAGKTALTIRLTEDVFRPTLSTDAAWATHLKLPLDDYPDLVNREIWLWDFAGQSDYRLIHQIFMDESALALLVFNGQLEDPLPGLMQWAADISKVANRRTRKLLVLTRADRGGLIAPRRDIDDFCERYRFSGYFETSAESGDGCAQLRHAIVENIDWSAIPQIASPSVFRRLKSFIIEIRDSGKILIRRDELQQQIEFRLAMSRVAEEPPPDATQPADLPAAGLDQHLNFDGRMVDAVLSLLTGPGVVKRLEFGDFIVLRPERLNEYASALIRSVRSHPEEMGWIEVDRVLRGDIDFANDSARLGSTDEQILLTAMVQMLVSRGVCFTQPGRQGLLLVFPYLFRRERETVVHQSVPLVTYDLQAPMHEVYATLVVRLSLLFEDHKLWHNAADFQNNEGKTMTVRCPAAAGSRGMITIAFERGFSDDTRVTVMRYVQDHLRTFDGQVVMRRNYECLKCHEMAADQRAIEIGRSRPSPQIFCTYCGTRIALGDVIDRNFNSAGTVDGSRALEIRAQNLMDNESKEMRHVGHVMSVVSSAGQIFRPTTNSDWGVDGEIEFKDLRGRPTGQRVYVQLKSGASYVRHRRDGRDIFKIKNARTADYWRTQSSPVWLIIDGADGKVRWMNISAHLINHYNRFLEDQARKRELFEREEGDKVASGLRNQPVPFVAKSYAPPISVEFAGVPFDAPSVLDLRDEVLRGVGGARSDV